MIENERQYEITKQWLEKFKSALVELENGTIVLGDDDIHPLLRKLESDSLKSQIEEFKHDIKTYEDGRNNVL